MLTSTSPDSWMPTTCAIAAPSRRDLRDARRARGRTIPASSKTGAFCLCMSASLSILEDLLPFHSHVLGCLHGHFAGAVDDNVLALDRDRAVLFHVDRGA